MIKKTHSFATSDPAIPMAIPISDRLREGASFTPSPAANINHRVNTLSSYQKFKLTHGAESLSTMESVHHSDFGVGCASCDDER